MFVHTVYFWLKDKHNPADHRRLHEGLKSLTAIDAIAQGWIGVPAPTHRPVIDSSYDFSVTFVFDDQEGHDTYQDHPVHLEFVQNCAPLWTRVQVYDAVPMEETIQGL